MAVSTWFSEKTLEHVADPTAVPREALRVTTRGGVVLMDVPDYHAWYSDTAMPARTHSGKMSSNTVMLRDIFDDLRFGTRLIRKTRDSQRRRSSHSHSVLA